MPSRRLGSVDSAKVTAAEVVSPVNMRQFPTGTYGCPTSCGFRTAATA